MATAAFLARRPDIEIHVFESKSEIRTIGSGIAIWKRFWDILEEYIDFEAQCAARGLQMRPWSEGMPSPILKNGPVFEHSAPQFYVC